MTEKNDLDSTIDSYIEKSPITNRCREQNPNLQPILNYNYEKVSSPLSNYETNSILKENEISMEFEMSKSSNSNKQKGKRFSLNWLNNFENYNIKKFRRYSFGKTLHKSLSKLTSSGLSIQSGIYSQGYNGNVPNSSASQLSLNTALSENINNSNNPFWKYHILKFGKDLYLTTNPGLKHMYCRNGPGYYVEIIHPNKIIHPDNDKLELNSKNEITLIFRDINYLGTSNKDSSPPLMIITKKSEIEGGYFTISITQNNSNCNNIKFNDNNSTFDNISFKNLSNNSKMFNGLCIPKKIESGYIPCDRVENVNGQYNKFKNYEFKDFNNVKWNIGSIIRIRLSKMTKFKYKFINNSELTDKDYETPEFKFIGKKNVYFHQNYIDTEDSYNPSNLMYKEKSNNPQKVYLHDSDNQFPPVLAFFRPYETKTRKRLIQSLNKNMNKFQQKPLETNKINNNSLSNDIGTGTNIHNYYKGGDGLYFLKNTNDDNPNDNKLGWITIYDDPKLFSETQKNIFDIVLGLTLAVGYESCLDS